MREVRNRPLLTNTYADLEAFNPDEGSAYFFGTSAEERSAHSKSWEAKARNVLFVSVRGDEPTSVNATFDATTRSVGLRSARSLQALVTDVGRELLYLDITGLPHHAWAPLLRAMLALGKRVRVVYVEPRDYRYSPTPTEGEIFDLSERISGIAPLPSFATLSRPTENSLFVPLLGYEGTRLRYVLEEVQPPGGRTVPVVGVPGFEPEYPFHAYYGNRITLAETQSWQQVRYARANCPFSAMYALFDIAADWPSEVLKIAPIGTKPHALGAVLFYLLSPRPVELVYDHPIRKAGRTIGSSAVHVYHVSSLQFVSTRLDASGRGRT